MCNYAFNNPCPWQFNTPMYNPNNPYNNCPCHAYMYNFCNQFPYQNVPACPPINLKDYGPNPFVINIDEATKQNNYFRIALWTGKHMQLTLMSINVGEDIGLEIHPDVDQFFRIEQGQGCVKMGDRKDMLDFQAHVLDDYAIIIPAGKWHNLINTGNVPLKLYSIYTPPQHPFGTVHKTKADAEEHHRR